MIKKIQSSYFADKNYALIYMHYLFINIAHAAMYVFTGAFFLKQGMPLHFVLLFYGLEFGLRGFLCPFGLALLNKLGIVKSLHISIIFRILFFIGVAMAEYNIWIGFVSFIFVSISGAIYYPFADVLEAIYIKDNHNRAKQLSLSLVASSLGRIMGTAGVGYVVANMGFDHVVVFLAAALILSNLPFLFLPKKNLSSSSFKIKDSYNFIKHDDMKLITPIFLADQLFIIARSVMIPIFIYLLVDDIAILGYVIAITVVIEKILTLAGGHMTDKLGTNKAMNLTSATYPLALLGYLFLAKSPLSIVLIESFQKINSNIFTSAFIAKMHNVGRQKFSDQLLLYGTAWQMLLCFGELVFLPLYALLAYFIGTDIFYIAFAFAVIGIWIIRYYLKHKV